MQKKALRVSGMIFLGFALAHALRLLLHVRVSIEGHPVSQGFSVLAIIFGIVMAGWMFRAAK